MLVLVHVWMAASDCLEKLNADCLGALKPSTLLFTISLLSGLANPSACQVCLAAGRIWKNYPRRIQSNFAKDNFKNTLRDGGLNYNIYAAFLFTVFALFTPFPLFALITLLSLIALLPLLTLFIPFTVLFCFTMLYNTVACMPLYIVIRLERYWNIFQ